MILKPLHMNKTYFVLHFIIAAHFIYKYIAVKRNIISHTIIEFSEQSCLQTTIHPPYIWERIPVTLKKTSQDPSVLRNIRVDICDEREMRAGWRKERSDIKSAPAIQKAEGQGAGHSRWVVWDDVLEGGQVLEVLVVEPLHLEVQVHVVRALAELVFLVLWGNTNGALLYQKQCTILSFILLVIFSWDQAEKKAFSLVWCNTWMIISQCLEWQNDASCNNIFKNICWNIFYWIFLVV